MAVAVMAAACTPAGSGAAALGTAVRASGPITSGVVGFNPAAVHRGGVYGFAFPILENVSHKPLSLTGMTLMHVPAGVRVESYRVLNTRDTRGFLLLSATGSGDVTDYDTYRDYLSRHISIAPGQTSQYYPVVLVKVNTSTEHGHLGGCQLRYAQAGKTFTQTLPCTYSLDGTS